MRATTPRASNWLDRTINYFSPRAALQRERARFALTNLRHYEGAAQGRRTAGWNKASGDANSVIGADLVTIRNVARDLVRNNAHARSALRTIRDNVVGWGIVAKPAKLNPKVSDLWSAWAETRACDTDGLNDFYGLQKLVMRTVVESGEVLVRRRFRQIKDGLPIPMQLQVIDPDYIDTDKSGTVTGAAGQVVSTTINGIEFDALGHRTAYWLFRDHPGSDGFNLYGRSASGRISAENILHVFDQERPGQIRGISWFAAVLLRFKDFDEYEDATLMKQKIAACLAVLTSDVDGTGAPLGSSDSGGSPMIDSLEPGMILNVPAGRGVEVVQPPSVREYAEYSQTSLRAIATGLGVTYEDLTGDYTGMPFSAARMSRIRHWAMVEDWRWRMLIPQFCAPVWSWAMEVAGIFGNAPQPPAKWTAPPMPMIEPDKEGLAYQRLIRTGITSLSEVIRERGYDPETVWKEMAADNKRLDALGLVLDSDARNTTQAGNPRQVMSGATTGEPEPPTDEPDEEPADDEEDDDSEEEEANP